ncbi:TLP18.3, Psb32 and MOLO-1 founding protein of phosphatase [Prosthecobacter debontii]|uniref:TLP18.3, Psb32 and MOLO-1 founding protein of phosphatase n=1 Tax=Prosthecobacter debontii TaxID=48467 RepID=A0A1T4YSL2_9BACT|nr:TPM domain-containing protein [Prosthecobacter debontii]SKB04847.1 TLP18.3, Psb32 and MOLO-1 founding protein of phosphatase [Prosthecobacter debontii]
MRCPACQTPALELDPACRQCGLTLEGLSQTLGLPPLLEPPLSDMTGTLSSGEERSARAVIQTLHQTFPQLSFAVVIQEWPADIAPALMAFWLFNKGSLFSAVEKGGDNHGVLLLLDPSQRRSAAMVGYGLEPFIPELSLEICLTAASGSLAKGRCGAAIEAFVRELERQLRTVLNALPKTFGLAPVQTWYSSSDSLLEEMEPAELDEDVY